MTDLVAAVREALAGTTLRTLDGMRAVVNAVHHLVTDEQPEGSRRTLLLRVLADLGIPTKEIVVTTPKGLTLTLVVAVLGPGTPTTGYESATIDVERKIVFSSPDGKMGHPDELIAWPDWVAGERVPMLQTGEEYTDFFSKGPRFVTFFIGDVCNAKCIMCWQALRRETTERDKWYKEMKAEVVEQVLTRHALSLEAIEIISFGEPMINPHFDRMVAAILKTSATPGRTAPLAVNITTNGSLVHRHVGTLMVPGYMTFSIDAAEKNLYERIRVGLQWDQVYGNLALAASHPDKHPYRRIGVALTIFEDNADQVLPMAEMCADLGLYYLNVLHGANLQGSMAVGREIAPTDPRLVNGIAAAKAKFPKLIINDFATGQAPLFVPPQTQSGRSFCPLPWRQFDVGPEGQTHPCCRSHHTSLGHALTDEVWNGETYRELRRQILADDVDPVRFKTCARCPQLGAGVRKSELPVVS